MKYVSSRRVILQLPLPLKAKQDRYSAIDEISAAIRGTLSQQNEEYTELQVDFALSEVKAEVLRTDTLAKQIRIDGRTT